MSTGYQLRIKSHVFSAFPTPRKSGIPYYVLALLTPRKESLAVQLET